MDPTNDPNFVPPSANKNYVPPAGNKVPKSKPIQPYVLEDYCELIDAPQPHPSKSLPISPSSASAGLDNHSAGSQNKIVHHKIPKPRTDLNSSSDDESDPKQENRDTKPNDEEKLHLNQHNSKHEKQPVGNIPRIHSFQIADLEEVPHGVQRQSKNLETYKFPTHRLVSTLKESGKYPLVIVACGSFSPITYLHLRMFEMAIDAIRENTKFEVVGGYYSPVSDNYKKQGLASAAHRVRMCELACERTSSWLMVDAWESLQPQYTRTALVLDHFNEEINIKRGGVITSSGVRKPCKIMLLAGGDLIESMGEPNVWADQDLHHILGGYGCLIVERTGSDVRSFLLSHDIMYEHRKNILVITQLIYNDISSTKVRLFIRRGMSVQYLLPNSVIRYIQEHKLYVNDTEPVKQVMGDKAD
ncbi:BA75_00887T0 [Komagataella pastoris]|uniref:Nicotinamide-nucleotide adenylyltransferase n=1 Tax=Komagataella pastoris TaxID=4922 RepID=A0A1B2J633_PICPA|nr:BA75_00887T0 [Komagataella pastoris]